MKPHFILVAAGLVVCAAAPAMAQASGDTSGPASGTTVKPSTAVQKEGQTDGQSGATAQTSQGGAPGTPAKAGTESGPAPKK